PDPRLHPRRRRRRARPGGGDRHLDQQAARVRPDGPARADLHAVRGAGRRAGTQVTARRGERNRMQNVPIALSALHPRREIVPAYDVEAAARKAAEAALEKKAENVVLVDLRGHASYADILVICSGTNERQLEAVADGVEKSLREGGQRLIGSEGARGSRWVLLDFG